MNEKICMNCVFWCGDKTRANKEFKNNSMAIDKFRGWVGSGSCKINYEFSNIEVNGNATADLEFDGSFGCNYFQKGE